MPAGTANTVENLVFLQLIYAVGVESFSLKIKEKKSANLRKPNSPDQRSWLKQILHY